MSKYAQVNVKFGADISQFSTAMQNAARDMKKAGDSLQNVGKSMTMNITAPIVALGAAALYSFGQIDALKRGLISFTGSAELAEEEFNKLREVAKLPGLGLEEAVRGSINLQAIGVNADKAREAMSAFGNAIATVGGGKESFDLAIRGFGQLINASKPLQQDLYQIANQLPQINKLMIEAFGTNRAEDLAKMGISGKQLADFLVEELGKLPKVTGGIKNSFENMSDSIKISLAGLGEAIEKNFNISGKFDVLAQWLTNLVEGFKSLNPNVQKFILGAIGIAAAIGPVLLGLGGILKILPLLRAGFLALNTAAPYIAAIGIAAILIYENWEKVGKVIRNVVNYFIDLYNTSIIFKAAINGQIVALKNMFLGLTTIFDIILINIKTTGGLISTIITGIGKLVKAILTGEFKEIPGIAKDMFVELVKTAYKGGADLTKALATFGTGVFNNIKGGMEEATSGKKLEHLNEPEINTSLSTAFIPESPTDKAAPKDYINKKATDMLIINESILRALKNNYEEQDKVIEVGWLNLTKSWDTGSTYFTNKQKEKLAQIEMQLNNMGQVFQKGIENMVVNLAMAFGENLVDGDPFKNLGNILLSSLGNLMVALGSEMIVFATLSEVFRDLMTNPLTWGAAIPVGIAMVAAGAAISKIASKGMQPATAGSGSYSGGSSYGTSGGDLTLHTRVDGRDLVLASDRTTYVKRR